MTEFKELLCVEYGLISLRLFDVSLDDFMLESPTFYLYFLYDFVININVTLFYIIFHITQNWLHCNLLCHSPFADNIVSANLCDDIFNVTWHGPCSGKCDTSTPSSINSYALPSWDQCNIPLKEIPKIVWLSRN